MSNQNSNIENVNATAEGEGFALIDPQRAEHPEKTQKTQSGAKGATKGKGKGSATKTQSGATSATQTTIYVPEQGTPYAALKKSRTAFSAFTIAAFIVGDFMSLTKGGLPGKAPRKGKPSVVRATVGATAWNHWARTTGRIEDGALTAKGLSEVGNRLHGNGAYRTNPDAVRKMADAMRKGGTVEVDGQKFTFDVTVKV